jgi:hypothetical protein
VVLNKFDTGRKRLSGGIRDLCSGGLVAAKLTVRASPRFTLKACPLHYPPPLRHFLSEPELYYPESHIQLS